MEEQKRVARPRVSFWGTKSVVSFYLQFFAKEKTNIVIPQQALMVEAIPIIDKKTDTKQRIRMALSLNDIGILLDMLENKTNRSIYHDPNKGKENEGKVVKTINFTENTGSIILTVRQKSNGETISVSKSFNSADQKILSIILSRAIEVIAFGEKTQR